MLRLPVVHRFEVGVALAERSEEAASVRHHAAHRPHFPQDLVGEPPFEHIQVAGLGVAVHLGSGDHPQDHPRGEPLDVGGERAPVRAGELAGAERLRVAHAEPGQRARLPRVERDAGDDQRPDCRAPPALVDPEDQAGRIGGAPFAPTKRPDGLRGHRVSGR